VRAKSTIKAGTNKSSNILTYWVTGPEEGRCPSSIIYRVFTSSAGKPLCSCRRLASDTYHRGRDCALAKQSRQAAESPSRTGIAGWQHALPRRKLQQKKAAEVWIPAAAFCFV
jgi:hypothetical protein